MVLCGKWPYAAAKLRASNFLAVDNLPKVAISCTTRSPWNKTVASSVYIDERGKPTKQRTQAGEFKGETTMQESSSRNCSQSIRRAVTKSALAIAILATAIAAAPVADAAPTSNRNGDTPANVVAHVEVPGGPVTRMLLLKKNGKEYLVLGADSAAHVVTMDVSEPSQPRTLDAAGTDGVAATELKVVADTLTIFGTSEAESTVFAGPKEIRSLPGVTAFVKDKAHGLIYATNGAGLWIIKTKRQADDEAQYYGAAN
jgi:hypothetical protein